MNKKLGSIRLAVIVSHPIQYYVPLYRCLANRCDVDLRVFFTWHGAESQQFDRGFKKEFAWDIPLTDGYVFEVVPNVSRNPGTHSFWGIRNPTLTSRLRQWRPDVVHITGFAFASHLRTMRVLARDGVPILFRGDSHLLNERQQGLRWRIKQHIIARIYSWPSVCLYVGSANKAYYRAFGVQEERLRYCPHSIEVDRFAEPDDQLERRAALWRGDLGIGREQQVLLFVGKFEDKKRPVELMKAFINFESQDMILVLVGDGHLSKEVNDLAKTHPSLFRVIPFQNQSRMPVVYRLGDIFVLPSAYDETWGLAVNEALACGRPAIVSDRVGGATDLISLGSNGEIFAADQWHDFQERLQRMRKTNWHQKRALIIADVRRRYSIQVTEGSLIEAVHAVTAATR